MGYTRAQIEKVLLRRAGRYLKEAQMDWTTQTGANDDLNDPIGTALRKSGYSVANMSNVADSDVGSVSVDDVDLVLDLAELRTLENIEGNLTLVNLTTASTSESLSDLARALAVKINRLRAKIGEEYGVLGATIEGGTVIVGTRPDVEGF